MPKIFKKPVKWEHFDHFLRTRITLFTCIELIKKNTNIVFHLIYPFQNISIWYNLKFFRSPYNLDLAVKCQTPNLMLALWLRARHHNFELS